MVLELLKIVFKIFLGRCKKKVFSLDFVTDQDWRLYINKNNFVGDKNFDTDNKLKRDFLYFFWFFLKMC